MPGQYIIVMENYNGVQDYLNSYTITNYGKKKIFEFTHDMFGEYYRYPRWETREEARKILKLIEAQNTHGRWAAIRVVKLRKVRKEVCKSCGQIVSNFMK